MLERLFDRGARLEQLRRAVAEDQLVVLSAELELAEEHCYTGREVAEAAGLGVEFFFSVLRAAGLAVPDPDEVAFGERDLDIARRVAGFSQAGLDRDGMLGGRAGAGSGDGSGGGRDGRAVQSDVCQGRRHGGRACAAKRRGGERDAAGGYSDDGVPAQSAHAGAASPPGRFACDARVGQSLGRAGCGGRVRGSCRLHAAWRAGRG